MYVMLVLALISGQAHANTTPTKQEPQVHKVLSQFIQANRHKNFKKAAQYTTGKQKDFYTKLNAFIRTHHHKIPKHLELYFNRIKAFQIRAIALDEDEKRSVALATLEFHTFDKYSHITTKTYRDMHYYLIKEHNSWKISDARLEKEYIAPPRG